MGLDMYLTAKRFAWGNDGEALTKAVRDQLVALGWLPADFEPVNTLGGAERVVRSAEINVGYWRKANAIHGWFVTNVQNGEDECQAHDVTREQITALREVVQKALDDGTPEGATALLPPMPGFFFGSVEIDEWYWDDLRTTLKVCDAALKLPDGWWLEYRSSW